MADQLLLPEALPNRHEWHAIVTVLQTLLPDIQGVVLYGSRVSGHSANTSDYDVLGVVHSPKTVQDRSTIGRELRLRTGLPVDLNLATLCGLKLHMLLDPYIKICLASGVKIGLAELPETPISRQGLVDALIAIELDLEDLQSQPPETLPSDGLRHVAKALVALEQATDGVYDADEYVGRLTDLTTGAATGGNRGAGEP